MALLIGIALAYLLGNLMGGHLLGRLRGVDLSTQGSGNVGATNALRTQGKGFAVLVLLIDVLKGLCAVLLVPLLPFLSAAEPEALRYACGAAVTLGHCYPALWGFRGGKGVATLAGAFGALMPWSLPWILGGFVVVVLLSGYVSLATILATAMAGLYVTCIGPMGAASMAGAFTLAMALLVLFKHRQNLARLATGTEHRFERLRILGQWLDR